jgi:hypothetical protein
MFFAFLLLLGFLVSTLEQTEYIFYPLFCTDLILVTALNEWMKFVILQDTEDNITLNLKLNCTN